MPAVDEKLQIEYVDPNTLCPFDGNPRTISEGGLEKLQRSVEEFGFVNPILAQKGTRIIIAGHQRVKAAQAAGLVEVPVVWLDVDDVGAKAYNIADNRLAEEAMWDEGPLAELMRELDEGAFDLTLTGFDEDEIERMMGEAQGGGDVVEDEVPEPPQEAVTKPGDLWILGRHRLLCGDSTVWDQVARLVGGKDVDLVFTDPPYNVDYKGGTSEGLTIANDNLGDEEFRTFLRDAFANMYAASRPGSAFYVCHSEAEGLNFRLSLLESGWVVKQCLVWAKNHFVLGRQDYQWRHEPILYGWKPGEAHRWYGGRKQSTVIEDSAPLVIQQDAGGFVIHVPVGVQLYSIKVPSYEVVSSGDDSTASVWRFEKPLRNGEHPTIKPVGIPARAIGNSTRPGESVLDLFGGSGSTLAAAEQTGRSCFSMELDPVYCDVIVERWQNLTGQKAKLAE